VVLPAADPPGAPVGPLQNHGVESQLVGAEAADRGGHAVAAGESVGTEHGARIVRMQGVLWNSHPARALGSVMR